MNWTAYILVLCLLSWIGCLVWAVKLFRAHHHAFGMFVLLILPPVGAMTIFVLTMLWMAALTAFGFMIGN